MLNVSHSQSKACANERNSHMEKINNGAFRCAMIFHACSSVLVNKSKKSSLLEKLVHFPLAFNISSACVRVCVCVRFACRFTESRK